MNRIGGFLDRRPRLAGVVLLAIALLVGACNNSGGGTGY
jgi:predicted small secreted protein